MPDTNTQRERQRAKVAAAMKELRPLLKAAQASDAELDWAAVEEHAAVIHRQSRLLAGKPRGG
jgi:hypothetical protein